MTANVAESDAPSLSVTVTSRVVVRAVRIGVEEPPNAPLLAVVNESLPTIAPIDVDGPVGIVTRM